MLAALRQSTESRQLVELARKYLQGVKGTLVQAKKLKAEKTAQRTALAQQLVGGSGATGPVTMEQVRRQALALAQQFNASLAARREATVAQREAMAAPRDVDARAATSNGAETALRVREYVPVPQQVMGQGHGSESGAGGTWRDAPK